MPFTPFASKLKHFITEMVENSRKGKTIDREVVVQKEVVKEVEVGRLQKLNVYALFADLFEDCPEESLEQFFAIFE